MPDLDGVASVKSPTIIMVTLLCGRVLSERAFRLLLNLQELQLHYISGFELIGQRRRSDHINKICVLEGSGEGEN